MTREELIRRLWEAQALTRDHIHRIELATTREAMKSAIAAYCEDQRADVTRSVQDLFYRMGLSDEDKLKPSVIVPMKTPGLLREVVPWVDP